MGCHFLFPDKRFQPLRSLVGTFMYNSTSTFKNGQLRIFFDRAKRAKIDDLDAIGPTGRIFSPRNQSRLMDLRIAVWFSSHCPFSQITFVKKEFPSLYF